MGRDSQESREGEAENCGPGGEQRQLGGRIQPNAYSDRPAVASRDRGARRSVRATRRRRDSIPSC
eukprot:5827957-Heterocapsa_arctica.AAC.1